MKLDKLRAKEGESKIQFAAKSNIKREPAEFTISNLVNKDGESEENKEPAHMVLDKLLKKPSAKERKNNYTMRLIPDEESRKIKYQAPGPSKLVVNDSSPTQQNNKNKGKKVNNWFTRTIEQKGEKYLFSDKLIVDEINAEKIVGDIVQGRINYNTEGKYLCIPIILETLIGFCSNKLGIAKTNQFFLGKGYNDYTNGIYVPADIARNLNPAIAISNQDVGIYELLYNKLVTVNATKNISVMFNISSELKNYYRQAKRRY